MVHGTKKKYDAFIVVSAILLLVLIGAYQKRTASHIGARAIEDLNYLPSGTFLKGMALGYDEAFADFLWVRTVGYFGEHVKTDQDFTWLVHMLQLTAELDPRYESPYEFAGVVLPMELNLVDEGMAFLKKGIRDIPRHNRRYWLQHFYLGFCYMIYKNDPIAAARHFEEAASFPQSPGYLPLLVGRLYASVNQPSMGIEIIQSILNDPDSDIARNEHMRNALIKRLHELMVAQDIALLENAVKTYQSLFGRPPSRLSDLTTGLILPFIPQDPFMGAYFLSMDGTKVYNTRSKGQFEVYKSDAVPKIDMSPR